MKILIFLKTFLVHSNGCGLTEEMSEWMDKIQNGVEEEFKPKTRHQPHNASFIHNHLYDHHPHQKYSKEANSENGRPKRAARFQEKNTCSLYIQTDPLIWRHIRESIPDHNDPNRVHIVDEKAKEEILSLVAHHVAAVNFIYRNTKFDGRVEHRNIRFEVRIFIF